ncbi:MAG: electron transfer flavoprotein subunit beta [Oscillospiraceae bacterium]
MKILVCVKQVPGTMHVEVDPVTGVLRRDGVPSKMNPYDLYALETAMTLREKYGGSVEALTMGPPQAKAILYEAIFMGADGGLLVSDRAFAGSDVLATSRTLSQAVKYMGGTDLIICGKQTTDGDTAQVGSEMAEFLGIPSAGNVLCIESADEKSITVQMSLENDIAAQRMPFPCLICVDSAVNTPRLPSYRRMKSATEGLVKAISLCDLPDKDEKHYGLSGSPTKVERIFPPSKNESKEMLTGSSAEVADRLADILRGLKFI